MATGSNEEAPIVVLLSSSSPEGQELQMHREIKSEIAGSQGPVTF